MKLTSLFVVAILIFSCSSKNAGQKSDVQKVSFGIYQTVRAANIPASVVDTLKNLDISPEKDQSLPIIGYLNDTATMVLPMEFSSDSVKLLKSVYTTGKEGAYHAVVVVRNKSSFSYSDIKKIELNDKNVEIEFNMEGSKKWAAFTKRNVGNKVAFVINDEVYSMPLINAEIKIGIAMITGFSNVEMAKKVADALNASL